MYSWGMPAIKKRKAVAKKTPKRAVAKKTVRPKTRTIAKVHVAKTKPGVRIVPIRHEAPADEYFWVNNGPVLRSIPELKQALVHMSDDQYRYHTGRDGNDFAKWIKHSLSHHDCASKIEKAKTRAGAMRALSTCNCC